MFEDALGKFAFIVAGMVNTIFSDVAQPDQARIVALNAHHFLMNGGHAVISIKVNVFRTYLILLVIVFGGGDVGKFRGVANNS